ncbi:MAG: hypothetical protein PVF91_03545 [Chromatiales bacterium]
MSPLRRMRAHPGDFPVLARLDDCDIRGAASGAVLHGFGIIIDQKD